MRQAKKIASHLLKRRFSSLRTLPFKITRQKANELFNDNKSFFEEQIKSNTESKSLIISKKDPVNECFIPFHTANVNNVYSKISGRYGKDRIEYYTQFTYDEKGNINGTKQVPYIVTDWYDYGTISTNRKNYPIGVKETQVYAGFVYPRIVIETSLQTDHLASTELLTKEHISFENRPKRVYPHEMKFSYAYEKILSRISCIEHTRAENYVLNKYGADHVEIHDFSLHYKIDSKPFSYYVPAYIHKSEIENLNSFKIINAYDGSAGGNKIYSILKTGLFGAGIGGVLTGLALRAIYPPYAIISLPMMVAKIAMGSGISGLITGTIARYRNLSHDYDNKLLQEKEGIMNQKYEDTEEDNNNRKIAESMNKKSDYIMINNINYPIDKCLLLGINLDKEITYEIVRKQFLHKVKEIHPDLNQDNKILAEQMTAQLNIAYEELTKLTKK